MGAARRSALKAVAKPFELQRTSLRLKFRRTFETQQQLQLEQYLAARFAAAIDPNHVRGRDRFIGERAQRRVTPADHRFFPCGRECRHRGPLCVRRRSVCGAFARAQPAVQLLTQAFLCRQGSPYFRLAGAGTR